MKKAILLAALAVAWAGRTQAQIMGRPIKSYTTRAGTLVRVGDTITLETGQRENGTFKYAEIAVQAFHLTEESLPATWNHRKIIVTGLREMPYKTGSVVTTVFKTGILNASLNADAAEESGEIATKNNAKKATPAVAGVADELLKLKSLLDSGAITQAEFEAQKAKLLK